MRYYARSAWLATVFISEDRDTLSIRSYKSSKLLNKRNIKGPIVSTYCDINSLGAVEQKSKKHSSTPCVSLRLLSCSTTPRVFISQNIDKRALLEALWQLPFACTGINEVAPKSKIRRWFKKKLLLAAMLSAALLPVNS